MPVTEAAGNLFGFLNDDNRSRWKGLLQNFLKGVLQEVHPQVSIDSDALTYLEALLYHLLAKICSSSPTSVQDVRTYVQENYPHPVNDWAIQEAEGSMDKIGALKKKGLPIDKIHHQIKDVLGHKVDTSVTCFILGVLDYVAADALKLAGNFMNHTWDTGQHRGRSRERLIQERDLKVSINVDQALNDLFEMDSDQFHSPIVEPAITADPQHMKHEDFVKHFTTEETKYIRHLDMLIKIYRESLSKDPGRYPKEKIEQIFGNIGDLHELSVQLFGMVEDCLEMVSDSEGGQGKCPQLGACFAELALNDEFGAYSLYAETIPEAVEALSEMRANPEALKDLNTLQPNIPMFREAVMYVLPGLLLEPIYHCLYYFEIIQKLMQTTKDSEDLENFKEAYSSLLGLKAEIDGVAMSHLPKGREELQRLSSTGYHANVRKLQNVQQSIESWEGPGISVLCTEYIMEGTLGFMREAGRKRTDRHIFLLDGLAILCKSQQKRSSSVMVGPEWRLKEKLNMRKAELKDLSLTENPEMKMAFELKERNQPGFVFFPSSEQERREWMAALTNLLTRSSFERLLDHIAKAEERNILDIRPTPQEYRFAEEDSENNIVFEKREGSASAIPQIKGGTLLKLVERLTHHKYADPAFVRIFLTTYRSFCKPMELLKLLIERFSVALPMEYEDLESRRDPLIREAVRRFKRQYQSPIQLRVLNAIRYWVEHHYYDFQDDASLLDHLMAFLVTIRGNNLKKWIESIHRTLQRQRDGPDMPVQMDAAFYSNAPVVEWHLTRNPDEFDPVTLHPLEIARQLTLIEAEYFRALHPSELVGCAWAKSQKEVTSPNYVRMVKHSTAVTYWLGKQILSCENFEERVAVLSRCIDIYLAFQDLNNFCGMFEVRAALESAAVYRLEHSFKALQPRKLQVLQEGNELIANHYKKYKEKLRSINPPCVPFLGMYLSDILFIEEGGKHILSGTDGLINFGHRRKVAEVTGEIQQYQNQPYCLHPVPPVQAFFRKLNPTEGFASANDFEEHLFQLSKSLEPKHQLPKKGQKKYRGDMKSPGYKPSKQLTASRDRKRNPSVPTLPEQYEGVPPSSPVTTGPASPTEHPDQMSTKESIPSSPVAFGLRKQLDSVSSASVDKPKRSPGYDVSIPVSTTKVFEDADEGSPDPQPPCPELPPRHIENVPHRPPPPVPDDFGGRTPPIPPKEPLSGTFIPPVPPKEPLSGTSIPPVPPKEPLSGTSVPPIPPKEPLSGTSTPPIPPKEPLSGTSVPPVPRREPQSGIGTPPIPRKEPQISVFSPPIPPKEPQIGIFSPPIPPKEPLIVNTGVSGVVGAGAPPIPPKEPIINLIAVSTDMEATSPRIPSKGPQIPPPRPPKEPRRLSSSSGEEQSPFSKDSPRHPSAAPPVPPRLLSGVDHDCSEPPLSNPPPLPPKPK